jgi:hypothetical protein
MSTAATSLPATTTSAPVALPGIGQAVRSGGITVTVKSARRAESVQLNESGFRPGSGYEKYTKTAAGAGATYVLVETHIINDGRTSLDLTCSLPMQTALVDDRDRNFDPIDSLYKIKGNPECNDQLQPGFETDMTWVYRLPSGANVLAWGYRDTTDFSVNNPYAVVRIL